MSGGPNIKILNATSQRAILQSVAVGTYTVQVTCTLNNQPGTATTVGKVQQPGSLAVITNTTPQWTCSNLPGSYITEERLIQYQVLDTSAVPIPVTGMNLTETLNEISKYVQRSSNSNGRREVGIKRLLPGAGHPAIVFSCLPAS